MINKIYKSIHNKYFKFFNFFFYLRYLFAIFLVSTSIFFLIPKFFDYEKKQDYIKKYLYSFYNLELENFNDIKFNILPLPNLLIQNANLKIKDETIKIKSKNVNIFLNLKSIYNYKSLKIKKIHLKDNKVSIDINKSKDLINYFKQLKSKLDVKNLHLNIYRDEASLIKIRNVEFSNYGYRKFYIYGQVLNKKFQALFKNNNKNLEFKILNTGINAKFNIDEQNLNDFVIGSSQISLLKNFLKFNFKLHNDQIKISNSNFRNKNLSFSLDSTIKFKPFFSSNSSIVINKINKRIVDKLSLNKILESKKILRKINSELDIKYKNKKYFINSVENFSSNFSLAYGRLSFFTKTKITGGTIECRGESSLIDQYPRLNFNCFIYLKDKIRFLKKFSVSKKNITNDPVNLNIVGSFNLFNKKINFKKISNSKGYQANEEDIQYFKENFEKILFNESFFKIFKKNKVQEFLLEIT